MLRGRYGRTSGRPYVEGRLIIPRIGVRTNISFCVDTGADRTILMPLDSIRRRIDFSALGNRTAGVGVGGSAEIFVEPAVLAFVDLAQAVHAYDIALNIVGDNPQIRDLPSLLGRDILNRWHMNYHPTIDTLEFEIISSDNVLPVAPKP